MNSTTALPPKAAKETCVRCGLSARSPIVVLGGKRAVCTDQRACAMRVRRSLNKAKEAKS